MAMQHGLKYVELPREINLGDPGLDWFYRRARVDVSGAQPGPSVVKVGQSCTYGITMITDGPDPGVPRLSYPTCWTKKEVFKSSDRWGRRPWNRL